MAVQLYDLLPLAGWTAVRSDGGKLLNALGSLLMTP